MTELELEPKSGKVQRRLFICLRLLSKDQDGRGFSGSQVQYPFRS